MSSETTQVFINGRLFRRASSTNDDHVLHIWHGKHGDKCYLIVDQKALDKIEKTTGHPPQEISVFRWRATPSRWAPSLNVESDAWHDVLKSPKAASVQLATECTYPDIMDTNFKDSLPKDGKVYLLALEYD